jgi:outer membrane protein assembly factor BamE
MRPTTTALHLPLFILLLLAGGCLYRMPIQQGNVLNPEQVAQLEPGMTRSQVMFLLGTPMVPNGFNTDRWDYYYYVDTGRRVRDRLTKRLVVWFRDDKVERVEGDAAAPKAGAATTNAG